jgi:hypothetical protein
MRATMKKPIMAGIFGVRFMDNAMIEIVILLMTLKTKLDHGTRRMLAMKIGMVKANKPRPDDTSSGVSLNANTTVRKSRNRIAATRPERKTLIQ